MRSFRRPFPFAGLIITLTAGAGLPLGWLLPGCGTDAVGIEACRQIERISRSGRTREGWVVRSAKSIGANLARRGAE